MSRKVRSVFNAEFKEDAVNLVLKQDYTVEDAANRLGIFQSGLGQWVRSMKLEKTVSGLSFTEKEELMQSFETSRNGT